MTKAERRKLLEIINWLHADGYNAAINSLYALVGPLSAVERAESEASQRAYEDRAEGDAE